ncbi:MAG TPA: hypothetical protein VH591_01735 [Ktedonobacterales bacterium]|jgi:hypothetical protein
MAEHSSRPGFLLRYSRWVRFFLPLVAVLVLLTGCGELHCNCPPVVTVHISAPNTRPITGLDRALLNAANGAISGRILGLASYRGSDGTGQTLAVLDGDLYAVPNANGQAALIRRAICPNIGIALSADASRLACLGPLNVGEDIHWLYGCFDLCFSKQIRIETFTPAVQPHISVEQNISDEHRLLSSPTWRPDGEAIAALDFANPPANDVSSAASASCAIAVYAQASANSTDIVPALGIYIADFSLCGALQVAWSPDGQTLAVLDSQTLLLLTAPSPATIAKASHTGHFVKSVLTPRLRIPLQQSALEMAWAPNGHSMAVVSRDKDKVTLPYQITQYPLNTSKPPTPLFGPDEYGSPIGPIAYSFDGRALIFAAGARQFDVFPPRNPLATPGSAYRSSSYTAQIPQVGLRPQICDCPQPPAGLYSYTLPTS